MAARKPVFNIWPPVIRSTEALELALAELCRIHAFRKHVEARATEAVTRIRQEFADGLVVTVGDKKDMPLEDWQAAVETAIEEGCKEFRGEWIEEGKKSREFNHGTVGWRNSKDKVGPYGEFPPGGNQEMLERIAELARELLVKTPSARSALADIAVIFVGDAAVRYFDFDVTFRKAELQRALKYKEVTVQQIRKLGLDLIKATENFYIDPKIETPESASSAETPK